MRSLAMCKVNTTRAKPSITSGALINSGNRDSW
jgi:hypothetical protein